MTAYTVTATWAGTGASNGGAMMTKVLTGAKPVALQTGVTANSLTVTAPELAITPGSTGSWVYGFVGQYAASTVFSSITAATQAAFEENFSDTTNNVAYGLFRSLNTTTGGTSTGLLGAAAATAPTTEINIGLVEILAAGTLAEDASSPAIPTPTKTAKTLVTASFTPVPGSLLVCTVVPNGTGTAAYATTVTSSPTLTWTQLLAIGPDAGTALGCWIAQVPGLAPPITQVNQAIRRASTR